MVLGGLFQKGMRAGSIAFAEQGFGLIEKARSRIFRDSDRTMANSSSCVLRNPDTTRAHSNAETSRLLQKRIAVERRVPIFRQNTRKPLTGVRLLVARNRLRRARRDDLSAPCAAFRAKIDHPVGCFDYI